MNRPVKILINPSTSFVRKYIIDELERNPIAPRQQRLEAASDVEYTIDTRDDHVTINRADGSSVTLRLPMVIGTGMTGEAARMTRMIYRGTYLHAKDSEARISVIHATDVAKAARLAMTAPALSGEYNICDGVNPTRHDMAEAIAYRLGQKRIYSLSANKFKRIARWADRLGLTSFGSKQLKLLTTDQLIDSSRWDAALGDNWHPVNTVEYLRTHNYDEHSL